MRLPEIPWIVPLSVRLQSGSNRIFASVYDALDFLEHEWPIRHGQGYERAVITCRGALNRSVPAGSRGMRLSVPAWRLAWQRRQLPTTIIMPAQDLTATSR